MKKERISGAEAVLRSLAAENVDTLFGYPGGAIMPIYDALFDYADRIHHVLVRHEQGAIHAAQGYARSSGKAGVCFATSGPGATNLITGLADAMIDSTPVVCITGQVASHLLGTDAFQETDVIGISMPITKWNVQVTKAEEIAPAIAKAFYIARSGRPGPVLIDITKDAQFGETEFVYKKCERIRSYLPKPELNLTLVQEAVKLINEAKRPFLLIGQGVVLSNAESELRAFAEKAGIPVASTLLGLGAFPATHELNVGFLGMHGNYAPNVKTNECDVLIAVGMRFDDRVTGKVSEYAKNVKVIHADIDHAELDKVIRAEVAIHADAKDFLKRFLPHVKTRDHSTWIKKFKTLDEEEKREVSDAELHPKKGEITMAEVIRILSEKTKGSATIVADVGQHQMVAARYYQFRKPDSYITSGGLGTMGFALPAAMGAKVGDPSREVIAIIGDGSFQMTLQELGTIMQEKLAVKIIILNNHFLGMVRQWQELFFENRYSFVHMDNPNFNKIADGFSVPNELVKERKDLGRALDRLLKAKGPYLLDIHVKKEDNVFPMIPSGAAIHEIRIK